jgi:hypothetical protein
MQKYANFTQMPIICESEKNSSPFKKPFLNILKTVTNYLITK